MANAAAVNPRSVLTFGLWAVAIVMALSFVRPAQGLSTGEILLFRDVTDCTNHGVNLYLTSENSTNLHTQFGWGDTISGWKKGSGSWDAYENISQGGSRLDIDTASDCDLTNQPSGNWSDRISSIYWIG